MSKCRLYIISPPRIELESFAKTLQQTLDAGDVASFQLRLKSDDPTSLSDDDILRACEKLIPITQKYDYKELKTLRKEERSEWESPN